MNGFARRCELERARNASLKTIRGYYGDIRREPDTRGKKKKHDKAVGKRCPGGVPSELFGVFARYGIDPFSNWNLTPSAFNEPPFYLFERRVLPSVRRCCFDRVYSSFRSLSQRTSKTKARRTDRSERAITPTAP